MNPDVLNTSVDNGIAVVILGSANRIFLDSEMTEAPTGTLEELAGNPAVRVVVLTGGAPGFSIRHYSVMSLLRFTEAVRNSGREWADNATFHGGFIDRARGEEAIARMRSYERLNITSPARSIEGGPEFKS